MSMMGSVCVFLGVRSRAQLDINLNLVNIIKIKVTFTKPPT